MASWSTYDLEIQRPVTGARWETHDVVYISWIAYCRGDHPANGTIHYMIRLDDMTVIYDYYDYHVNDPILGPNSPYFTLRGNYRWVVPGDFSYRNPNAPLKVYSGNDDCPNCYDILKSVIISVKMWYDPLPIPIQPEASSKQASIENATWGTIKSLFLAK